MSRHRSFHVAFIAILTTATLVGCDNQQAPPAPPPQAVAVVTLQPQPVTLIRELPGRTTAYLVAEVRPQVSGIVQKRLFTEGGPVKAGQPLYQIDDATYRAEFASAQASLARARATANSAGLNAKRSAGLIKIDAVSQQDNENAVAAAQQAEADVKAAEAAVQSSEILVNYAKIVSPISGRIGKSSVTPGALVTADQQTPLATVQQLDPIYVDLTQSSSELLQLRKAVAAGTLTRTDDVPVTILLEDGTRYAHDGKLSFADVTVVPSTGSFMLRVVVPNPENILLPGMYVRALVSNGERANGLLVPQQAIARDPKGNTSAMLVGKDGKVEMRPVQVSRAIADKWLVDGGLAAGDRVIVEGLQKVQPGMPVQASEAVAATQPEATAPAAAGTTSPDSSAPAARPAGADKQ